MYLRFFYAVFLTIIFLSAGCKSSIPTSTVGEAPTHQQKGMDEENENSLPEWMASMPDTSVYYVSIKGQSKNRTGDVIEATLKEAKQGLFHQLPFDVHEHSFINKRFPKHLETYKKQQHEQLPSVIGGETFRGIYETQDSIWVYCRLKKTRFDEVISHKRAAALSLAKSYLINGEQLASQNPGQALQHFARGMWTLRYFWHDDLTISYQDNEISLAEVLDKKLNEQLNKLSIRIEPKEAQFNPLEDEDPVIFTAYSEWGNGDKSQNGEAKPLPINCAFLQGEGKVKTIDDKTYAYPSADTVDTYKLRFNVHPSKIITHDIDGFAQFYWNSLPQQSKTVPIHKIKPTLKLITDRDSSHTFVKKLHRFIADHNLKESDDPTVYIQLTEKEEFKLNEDQEVVAKMTLYMELVNVSTGKIMERNNIGPVEGTGDSEGSAREEAYKNAFKPTSKLLLKMFWPYI